MHVFLTIILQHLTIIMPCEAMIRFHHQACIYNGILYYYSVADQQKAAIEAVLSDLHSRLLFCAAVQQKAAVDTESAFGDFQQHIKLGYSQSIAVDNQHDLVLRVTRVWFYLSLFVY